MWRISSSPHIFGFELLMAPYAVVHLKLGLLLQETGYEFKSEHRGSQRRRQSQEG